MLERRENECRELRESIDEYEAQQADTREKFEATLEHLQGESDEKDAEIQAANREIEQYGHRIYELEEENERIKQESDRWRDEEADEREKLETLSSALKEVSFSLCRRLHKFDVPL